MSFRRLLAFAVAGLVLYAVAPAIAEVFGAWPHVRHIAPAWFAAMFVAQAGSLWCLAKLQALCMGVSRTGPVLTSSLASGALGRVLPGGSATAAATQYGMLTQAGVDGTVIGVGLAAIGAHGSLALTLLAYAATQLLGQIPITPGGLGVVEAALTGSLVVAGTSTAQAALATLAYRLVSYWLVVLAGLVAWLVHRRRDRHASGPSAARS